MTDVPPNFQKVADHIAFAAATDMRHGDDPDTIEMQCRAYIRAFGRVLKDLRGAEIASAELYACADKIATGGGHWPPPSPSTTPVKA